METSLKITNHKFRFHISTFESENNNISIGGNNYNASLKVKFLPHIDHNFTALTNYLLAACEAIHHRTVVPTDNPYLVIKQNDLQVFIDSLDGLTHYALPKKAVAFCKMTNAKIEDFSLYLLEGLVSKLREDSVNCDGLKKIKLKVFQNVGPLQSSSKYEFRS